MNILHHKSWHVRNKDNIARVRRDEAKAAEEEKKKQDQIERAEREARINFLRSQQQQAESENPVVVLNEKPLAPASSLDEEGHLNLFKLDYTQSKSNKEHESEKKEEKEKYEKQIGYLTYLGQYQNEDPHLKRWYDMKPKRYDPNVKIDNEEDIKDAQKKKSLDPMKIFVNAKKTYKPEKKAEEEKLGEQKTKDVALSVKKSKSKKIKKEKKNKKDKKKKDKKDKNKSKDKHHRNNREEEKKLKSQKLKELREQRLKREAAEKLRQQELLKKHKKI